MTGQRIPGAPDHIVRQNLCSPGAEQLHTGHFEAHAAFGQGKWRASLPSQPGGEDICLRQARCNQAERLAVDFTALTDGADRRD